MSIASPPDHWLPVCALSEIIPNTGVCALVDGQQIAVFHVVHRTASAGPVAEAVSAVYAIGNYDPNAEAAVLSRGLVGSLGERIVVASPMYKHHFDLRTGECLEAPHNSVRAFAVRVADGRVWLAL